ncbi:MAG: methyltransferase [Bacteroidetes bacterium]|nr:methyltransferase [Bacteroidota bacterium]
MRKAFRFKRFSLSDEGCAMKLGTDAVILGSWVRIGGEKNVLDIGCGCGILSLMMAQRTIMTMIKGIDLHEPSVVMAKSNFNQSPWSTRLSVQCLRFQEFAGKIIEKFDLILSNPPYFVNSLKAADMDRRLSRHTDELSYGELLDGVSHLLSPAGRFAVILPYLKESQFINMAQKLGLYPDRLLRIRSKPGSAFIRTCLDLSFSPKETAGNELVIRNTDGSYTKEYQAITADFYLAF